MVVRVDRVVSDGFDVSIVLDVVVSDGFEVVVSRLSAPSYRTTLSCRAGVLEETSETR